MYFKKLECGKEGQKNKSGRNEEKIFSQVSCIRQKQNSLSILSSSPLPPKKSSYKNFSFQQSRSFSRENNSGEVKKYFFYFSFFSPFRGEKKEKKAGKSKIFLNCFLAFSSPPPPPFLIVLPTFLSTFFRFSKRKDIRVKKRFLIIKKNVSIDVG